MSIKPQCGLAPVPEPATRLVPIAVNRQTPKLAAGVPVSRPMLPLALQGHKAAWSGSPGDVHHRQCRLRVISQRSRDAAETLRIGRTTDAAERTRSGVRALFHAVSFVWVARLPGSPDIRRRTGPVGFEAGRVLGLLAPRGSEAGLGSG